MTDAINQTVPKDEADELELFQDHIRTPDFPFSIIPLPTVWGGFAIAVSLLLIWFGAVAALGQLTPVLSGEMSLGTLVFEQRDRLTILLLLAYVLTANERGRREFLNDYLILQPALQSTLQQRLDILTSLVEKRQKRRAIAAIVSCVLLSPILFAIVSDGDVGILEAALVSVATFLLIASVAAAAYDLYDGHRRIILLMDHGLSIDLLNMTPMRALARSGVRSAAATAVGCALAIPLLTQQDAVLIAAAIILFILLQAIVMMVLPARHVRQKIVAEKTARLDEVNGMISSAWKETLGTDRDSARRARAELAGLIAYRDMISDVPEWPFGAPTLLRMFGLIALPVLSWLAAAFVEQIVERSLG